MEQFRTIPSLAAIESLMKYEQTSPKDGEIFVCLENNKTYIIKDRTYEEFKPTGGLNMSLYELNKTVVSQLRPLDPTERSVAKAAILNWSTLHPDNFYMLYGKEISYFTIFMKDNHFPDVTHLAEGVFECLDSLGEIHSIERTEDRTAVEIWISTNEGATCLYLFPYGEAIVRIKE